LASSGTAKPHQDDAAGAERFGIRRAGCQDSVDRRQRFFVLAHCGQRFGLDRLHVQKTGLELEGAVVVGQRLGGLASRQIGVAARDVGQRVLLERPQDRIVGDDLRPEVTALADGERPIRRPRPGGRPDAARLRILLLRLIAVSGHVQEFGLGLDRGVELRRERGGFLQEVHRHVRVAAERGHARAEKKPFGFRVRVRLGSARHTAGTATLSPFYSKRFRQF
jgi:hypothetical protein